MSYLSFLADAPRVSDFGDWLLELYPLDPDGVTQTLRFSRRGTVTRTPVYVGSPLLADDGSEIESDSGISIMADSLFPLDTIPAHTPYRKRLLQAPTLSQSLWQPGRILANSLPSFGSIRLTNQNGDLDQYRQANGWTWAGQPFRVFFCDTHDVQDSIGKVADGLMGEAEFSISEVGVPLLGNESLFNVPLSQKVYRGTSYLLELFGDRTISFGTPAALDLTGAMTLEGWHWLESLPTVDQRVWGWCASTNAPWRFGYTTLGQIFLGCTIGGIGEAVVSTYRLGVKKPYHIAIIVNGRGVDFYIWDDDLSLMTIESYSHGFSTATRDAHSGGAYVIRTNSDATLKPWMDEWRVWATNRDPADIETDRFRPLSSSVPFPSSCVHCLGFDDGTGTTVTDSSATAAHGTITGAGTSTWFWAQEGGPELAGVPKPDVYGEAFGCRPVLVDNLRLGYQVAGGGSIQSLLPLEGGLSPTLDADATTLRGYLTTTPAPGHCLRYPQRGLFKLGSDPTFPLSATVIGYNGGDLGYSNRSAGIIRKIVTERGPKLVDPDNLDVLSFDSYNTATPGIMGVFIPNPTDGSNSTIGSTLDLFTLSGSGWWGYVRASNLFHLEQFTGASSVPDYRFDQRKIIDFVPMPPLQVVYGVVVKFRHNHVVHTEAEVAANSTFRALGTWKQFTMEWQEARSIDSTVRARYPGKASILVTVETALQYREDAQVFADFLRDLLVGPKEGWTITVSSIGLQIKAGQTCTVRVNMQNMDESIDRLGLDGTRLYAIVGVEDNRQAGTIKLNLWGDSTEAGLEAVEVGGK